jgi:carbamoylphosphate synthase large subunit
VIASGVVKTLDDISTLSYLPNIAGVPLLGTPVDAIDLAEDRGRFGALLRRLEIPIPPYPR